MSRRFRAQKGRCAEQNTRNAAAHLRCRDVAAHYCWRANENAGETISFAFLTSNGWKRYLSAPLRQQSERFARAIRNTGGPEHSPRIAPSVIEDPRDFKPRCSFDARTRRSLPCPPTEDGQASTPRRRWPSMHRRTELEHRPAAAAPNLLER